MKKMSKILSAVLLTTGFYGVSSFASDTTTVTKATVKLIQQQRELQEDVALVKDHLLKNDEKFQQLQAMGKDVTDKTKVSVDTANSFKTRIDGTEKTINEQNRLIQELKARLDAVEKSAYASKEDNRMLNERIDSLKKIMESELKIIKAKLEGLEPVYILEEKEVPGPGCASGKCPKSIDTKVDDTINNFIQK